ncbi:hypothetical protein LZ31DRAFT_557162, partial [Colletotrichum somersetense]
MQIAAAGWMQQRSIACWHVIWRKKNRPYLVSGSSLTRSLCLSLSLSLCLSARVPRKKSRRRGEENKGSGGGRRRDSKRPDVDRLMRSAGVRPSTYY